MGLFDRSRRTLDADRDLLRRIGRLEADVESIKLQWADYKDVLTRLVQRLEKRDQRAAERAERETAEAAEVVEGFDAPDATTARVLSRRRTHNMRRGNGVPD
jgi:hypothetical protein